MRVASLAGLRGNKVLLECLSRYAEDVKAGRVVTLPAAYLFDFLILLDKRLTKEFPGNEERIEGILDVAYEELRIPKEVMEDYCARNNP